MGAKFILKLKLKATFQNTIHSIYLNNLFINLNYLF